MLYSFADAKAPDRKHTQYFEIMGSRGIYHDGWMASAFGPKVPWRPDLTKLMSWTPDQDVWELYNIDDDFSQADDLAAKEPAKLAAMKELFTIEAAKNNVFPVGGGLLHGPQSAPDACLPSDPVDLIRRPESHRRNSGTQFQKSLDLATVDAEIGQRASGVLFARHLLGVPNQVIF